MTGVDVNSENESSSSDNPILIFKYCDIDTKECPHSYRYFTTFSIRLICLKVNLVGIVFLCDFQFNQNKYRLL